MNRRLLGLEMLVLDKKELWQAQCFLVLGQRVCAMVAWLELCRLGKDPVPVEKNRSVEGLALHFSDVGLEGLQEVFLVLLLL